MEPHRSLTGIWVPLAALRFAAEVGLLASLAYVGWQILGAHPALGLLSGLVLAALAATVWGAWVAPQARQRLDDPARLAVELVLFGATITALVLVGGEAAQLAALGLGLAYVVSAPVGRKGF